MTDPESILYGGRSFSSADVLLMRQAARDYAALGITEIARTICEWLDWKRPNGQLKNHECRLLLERLDHQEILTLPALRRTGRRGPRPVAIDASTDSPMLIQATVAQLQPLRLSLVESSDSALWRQLIERYHYLGCRVPVGAHLRYFVKSGDNQILACLLWTSPAWMMTARDQWIGWTPDQRARNLQYIVNNGRFLILPWVQVKGLASAILARSARQLPHDWCHHYGYTPLLLETLVDAERFKGTCYRAANWIYLGNTTAGIRTDRLHRIRPNNVKRLFVFPLHRHAQQCLCSAEPPTVRTRPDQ
ncbi:MAG TPA: Druantia anti-phage system protein DruA [Terriglobales bacterium]|nr:Druantia anti-phage system protein DruA [Terriglobales bacterium]